MPLDAIIPYLYICDETTARDFKQLTDAKIKGIISLTGEIAFPNSIFKYFNFGIMDKLTQDISITIKQTNEIIDKYIEHGENILVFCGAGSSRSGAIVIAYLMHTAKIDYYTALSLAQQRRPIIQPNPSFEYQLVMQDIHNEYPVTNHIPSDFTEGITILPFTYLKSPVGFSPPDARNYILFTHIPFRDVDEQSVNIILSSATASEIISRLIKNTRYVKHKTIICGTSRIMMIVQKWFNICRGRLTLEEAFSAEQDYGIIYSSIRKKITPIEYLKNLVSSSQNADDINDYGIAEIKKLKKLHFKI